MTRPNPTVPVKFDKAAALAVEEFLVNRFSLRCRPFIAARVLTLVCELWAEQKPFPQRAAAARVLKCSVHSIDNALSTYAHPDRGPLIEHAEVRQVKSWKESTKYGTTREITNRQVYYQPALELMEAAGCSWPRARNTRPPTQGPVEIAA